MMDTMKDLKKATTRLNEESNDLNSTLEKIQDKIGKLNVGLEVWLNNPILIDQRTGDAMSSTREELRLGWSKTKDEWGLAFRVVKVESGYEDGDLDCPYSDEFNLGIPLSLMLASRQVRIDALKLLPDLVEAIKESVESTLSDIENAKELANAL